MQEQVSKILSDLKGIKIAASTVEKELGFANGQLGQAAKGKSRLSEERLAKLVVYHNNKINDGKAEPEKDKKKDTPPSLDPPKDKKKKEEVSDREFPSNWGTMGKVEKLAWLTANK